MKIQEVLDQPEGKSLEFKKEIPKNRQNLLKTVVAFANGVGGTIYKGCFYFVPSCRMNIPMPASGFRASRLKTDPS